MTYKVDIYTIQSRKVVSEPIEFETAWEAVEYAASKTVIDVLISTRVYKNNQIDSVWVYGQKVWESA